MALLKHGGGVYKAAEEYGIPYAQWLDLSTGLNPQSYPVADIPPECWQRLPEDGDGLRQAAEDYYGSKYLLPVAGSQIAIQTLPKLRPKSRVGYFPPAYAEHAWNWRQAGHEMIPLQDRQISDELLATLDVLLVVNPNNPDGHCFDKAELQRWHRQLQQHNAWLVVDEAFMDVLPENSLLSNDGHPEGLIVLRSLGKFFGLAGLRVGFVFAWEELLEELRQELGPWHINHPARWVATQALQDTNWHQQTRAQLRQASMRLLGLLQQARLCISGSTDFFAYVEQSNAEVVHQQLAQQGILTRLFDEPRAVRFGLPGNEQQWQRLEKALQTVEQS